MTAPTLEAERAEFDKALAASFPDMPAREDGGAQNAKFIAFAMFQAGISLGRRTAAPVAEGVALPPLDAETVRDSTWRNLLDAVLREFPRHMGRSNNGNAPGHCHSRPGIWDDDNGAIAGKPCAWCIAWNGAAQALAAAPSPLPPQEEAK